MESLETHNIEMSKFVNANASKVAERSSPTASGVRGGHDVDKAPDAASLTARSPSTVVIPAAAAVCRHCSCKPGAVPTNNKTWLSSTVVCVACFNPTHKAKSHPSFVVCTSEAMNRPVTKIAEMCNCVYNSAQQVSCQSSRYGASYQFAVALRSLSKHQAITPVSFFLTSINCLRNDLITSTAWNTSQKATTPTPNHIYHSPHLYTVLTQNARSQFSPRVCETQPRQICETGSHISSYDIKRSQT